MRLAAVLVAAASFAAYLPAASAQSLTLPSPGRKSPAEAPRIVLDPGSLQFLAQTGAQQAAQSASCPVGMEVRNRGGMGQALAISPGSHVTARSSQTLDLTIVNRAWSNITSIDAVVHTLTGKLHLMPVESGTGDADEGDSVPMHLGKAIGTFKEVGVSWSLESSSVIRSIEISRVTFSDGSTWSASSGSHCRFTPGPVMLVAGR